jgi:hypothetical protein
LKNSPELTSLLLKISIANFDLSLSEQQFFYKQILDVLIAGFCIPKFATREEQIDVYLSLFIKVLKVNKD